MNGAEVTALVQISIPQDLASETERPVAADLWSASGRGDCPDGIFREASERVDQVNLVPREGSRDGQGSA